MTPRRYLLDTVTVSDLARNPHGQVAKRLAEVGVPSVAISIVVAAELRFGVAKSGSIRLARRLALLLDYLEILPLGVPVDEHYGEIRLHLERAGTPIGPNDLLIAAHGRSMGMTVVTDNLREFRRVPGLHVENWLGEGAGYRG